MAERRGPAELARAARSLTGDEALARRLSRHSLLRAAPRRELVDVVREICGLHAQVMASAELSLGLRVSRVTRADLARELWERKTLVKTYGIRGTVHLFPSDELPLWLAAFGAQQRDDDERRLAYLGLTRVQMDAIVEAIGDALEERRLTREELGERVSRSVGGAVVERTVSAFGGQWPVWMSGIGAAANAGRLCFGPNEGTRVTYENPARWLGRGAKIDGTHALREVFRRYLRAYGPATPAQFAQWFGMAPSRARDVAAALAEEVEEVELDGTAALQLRGERATRRRGRSAVLLPRFDPYIVGSHPRDTLIPPAVVERAAATGILPKRSGTGRQFLCGPMPVLLLDGVVAGVWEHRREKRRVEVRVQPFTRLGAADRTLVEAAARGIGAVLEEDVTFAFGAISTRPHL